MRFQKTQAVKNPRQVRPSDVAHVRDQDLLVQCAVLRPEGFVLRCVEPATSLSEDVAA